MRTKTGPNGSVDKHVKEIKRKARRQFSAEKRRLGGDTTRQATPNKVTGLKREARDLKEVVAKQTLELRLPKKRMRGDGGDLE